MKNVNIDSIEGLEDLSNREITNLTAGETLWYWVAYGIGATARGLVSAWNELQSDPRYLDGAMMY